MSFTCTLYSFQKPINSTKLPGSGDNFPCTAVEPCSVVNPTVSLYNGPDWNPSGYNYAYISDFGRYYWINECTTDHGRWYISMTSDPLASFRSQILSRIEYVIRAESKYNLNIVDQYYPATSDYAFVSQGFRPFAANELSSGTFVLGIANGRDSSIGGITYYCGEQSELSQLFEFMYNTTDWLGGANIDDISNDLLKCLVNPGQYISSLMWFPLAKEEIMTPVSAYVGAGWWQTDILLSYTKGLATKHGRFKLVPHPQAERGTYLNRAPYTTINVYVPGFGTFPLNTDKIAAGDSFELDIQIDTVTGSGTLFIYPADQEIGSGQQFTAQIGVPIAVTSMNSDILGGATAIGSSIAKSDNIISGIFGAIGGIADAAKMMSPDVSVVGTNGNMSVFENNACVNIVYKKIADEDIGHFGRPLCERILLSDLHGFVMVKDFDPNLSCTEEEQRKVKTLVEGGFYIE